MSLPPAAVVSMLKSTPAVYGAVILRVLAHDAVAPLILPLAVIVVDDEIPLPSIDPLVVDVFPFVVDMFPDEAIAPFVVMLPAADIPNRWFQVFTSISVPLEKPFLEFEGGIHINIIVEQHSEHPIPSIHVD